MSTKAWLGFLLFCLNLELLIKMLKASVQKPGLFLFLQITEDLDKIKKYQTAFCR